MQRLMTLNVGNILVSAITITPGCGKRELPGAGGGPGSGYPLRNGGEWPTTTAPAGAIGAYIRADSPRQVSYLGGGV